MEFLEIDGSIGEGGGQILRTAVALAATQGRSIRVRRIRAGRREPGLRRQHVAALAVLTKVFSADTEGVEVGSQEISFSPNGIHSKEISFETGSAASTTLILQAVIPAVALAGSTLQLQLVGGTDVPWSPNLDYFRSVIGFAFELAGLRFSLSCPRRGYYPKGGGIVKTTIEPSSGINPLTLVDPPTAVEVEIESRSSNLPAHVARRQLESARTLLRAKGFKIVSAVETSESADSPGSSIMLHVKNRPIGADSIGARGKRAEEVGLEAASDLSSILRSGAAVDVHVADMLVPVLAMAGGRSTLRVPSVTSHLETSLQIARLFTGCRTSISPEGSAATVSIWDAEGQVPRQDS